MAQAIGTGLIHAGAKTVVKNVKEVRSSDILSANIVVVGSATHAGEAMGSIKSFFDKLPSDIFKGKCCGAFAVHGVSFGKHVVEDIMRYFKLKGGKNVRAGPVVSAGFFVLPIRRPKKADLERGIEFGESFYL